MTYPDQIIDNILLRRIKFIDTNEQIYTGCPADLIKELSAAFRAYGEQVKDEIRTELSKQRTKDDLGFPLEPNGVIAECVRKVMALKLP